jgi:hypothetical protein
LQRTSATKSANSRQWSIYSICSLPSPPPHRPSITLIGASGDKVVPDKGKQREQKRPDADWHD